MAGHGLVPDWLFGTSLPSWHKPIVLSDSSSDSDVSQSLDTLYGSHSTLSAASSLATTPTSSRQNSPSNASTLRCLSALRSVSTTSTIPSLTKKLGLNSAIVEARGNTAAKKRPREEEDKKPWVVEEERHLASWKRRSTSHVPADLTLYVRMGNTTRPLGVYQQTRVYSIKVSILLPAGGWDLPLST